MLDLIASLRGLDDRQPVFAGNVAVKSEAPSALTNDSEPPDGFFNFKFAIIELPE